ncbi:MAG: hypothetical protein D6725_14330 [Planctomycetota bacterium]|nr:MAG: hypothetical protein D6725_14330 [Planctomycetota bacterium]
MRDGCGADRRHATVLPVLSHPTTTSLFPTHATSIRFSRLVTSPDSPVRSASATARREIATTVKDELLGPGITSFPHSRWFQL